jgi:zinc protease
LILQVATSIQAVSKKSPTLMALDRTIPPSFQPVKESNFPWPAELKLPQGLPMFVLNQGTQPIIRLTLVFDSGTWYEPQDGIAYFTAKMLQEGTKNKSAHEIASYIDQYGAELAIDVTLDYCYIELTTLTKHFDTMLRIFAELLFNPSFPDKQLDILKNIKMQAIKVENEKNQFLANKRFKEALWGKEHPYGRNLTIEAIANVTTDHLQTYYQQQLLLGCKILLTGQVNEANIQAVQEYLQPLTNQQSIQKNHALAICSPTKLHVPKPNSLQSSINIGKILFTKHHPDFLPLRFVVKLLGGYFGSRLMTNLREDKGYTYGIHATIRALKHASYLLIATDVKQEFAEHTCEQIYAEIKTLQTQLVSPEELQRVRNYILGNFLATVSDPFSILERFKEAYLYGLDQNFYQQWYQTITQIKASQILALANQYLTVDGLTEIKVG